MTIRDSTLPMPFEVPEHPFMVHRCPGKEGTTVLVIEMQIFNAVIREYTEPLSWRREWSYETDLAAWVALASYLMEPEAEEPRGWVRAVCAGQPTRRSAVEQRKED